MSNYGIVEYFGCNNDSYPCGYCKGIKRDSDCGKFRAGMWAHSLININYQNLIDRNWRRSGKYCYKPILNQSCCPMYTIRCDALNFKLKKSQKKVIKKLNQFLKSGEKPSKTLQTEIQEMHVNNEDLSVQPILDINEAKSGYKLDVKPEEKKDTNTITTTNTSIDNMVAQESNVENKDKPIVRKNKKAKDLRIERQLNKIMEREKCDQKTAQNMMKEKFRNKIIKNDKRKSLEDYLNETENSVNNRHKLKIRYVSTTTDEYKETLEVSHKIYQKYQNSIHNDPIEKCTLKQYKRFLIDSPLENEVFEISDELPDHFGSYHQQYWLDNRLIAVGVIDILPKCVSSVYLYYDPQFDFLSLGTYSALREIYLVQRLQRFVPELKYYYMGFYINSCPKMKYKAKFCPAELLCGETFSWHSIDKCLIKLNASKYSRFEDNLDAIDSDGNGITDEDIKILYMRSVITFTIYKSLTEIDSNEEQQIREYAKLVGRQTTNRLLLYRS